jgi:glycine/D-amino acid oxidase-like deaminating enzyme
MYTMMAVESFKLWKDLEKESGRQLMITTGLLMINGEDESANRFNKTSYDTLEEHGLGAEMLQGLDLKLRFPQFMAETGFLDPHGGVLLASKALSTFRDQAAERGKMKFHRAQARRLLSDNDAPIVELDSGEQVKTQKLIVSIGSWSSSVLRPGLAKIAPTRQQLMYFRPRTKLDDYRPISFPVFFTDHHYGLPAAGIDAVKVSPKELPEKTDPETANRRVDEDQVKTCRNVVRKFIPGLYDGDMVHSKVCIYDMTENTDFVIDKDPENQNIVYGYGFSGHGFKFAPLVGKFLAELTLDKEANTFNLDRFTIVPSDRTADKSGQLGKD